MKAISLWQPYAALIALGFKKIETRSWPTTYRGPLAIHAAQKTMPYIEPALRSQMEKQIGMNIFDLPRGGIVATVNLIDGMKVTAKNRPCWPELYYGDYSHGRFMWLLADVLPLKKIIPFRGRQGLFDIPDEALQVCRVCGCSEFNACEGGCAWIEKDLCSSCVDRVDGFVFPSGHSEKNLKDLIGASKVLK